VTDTSRLDRADDRRHQEGRLPCRPFLRLGAAVLALLLGAATRADASDRVALVLPLSGARTTETAAAERAVRDAALAIGTRAGPAFPAIDVAVHDDGCAAARAVDAARRIVAERVALVIGHPCPAAATAAAPVYAAAGILFIATGPRHPELTRRRAGPSIFRLAGRDDEQGPAAGRYIAAKSPGARVAIVHDRTRYARGLADGLRIGLATAGAAPIAEIGIVAADKDFSAAVRALAAARAEIVYIAGFPTEAMSVARHLAAAGLKPHLVGPDALATDALGEEMSRLGLDMSVTLSVGLGEAPSWPSRVDARDFAAALEVWAAARAAVAEGERGTGAIAATEARDTALRTRLSGSPLATVAGPIRFVPNGDAEVASYGVARFHDGHWALGALITPPPSVREGDQDRVAKRRPGQERLPIEPRTSATRPGPAHPSPSR